MRALTIAALVAAQLLPTAPAPAADLHDDRLVTQQRATFAGARIRMPFGGSDSGNVRASLSLTSMQKADLAGGPSRTRFGEGIEFTVRQSAAPELRLGGMPLAQRHPAAAAQENKPKKGEGVGKKVLKGGAILLIIGAVVVGGLVLALFAHCETTTQCED